MIVWAGQEWTKKAMNLREEGVAEAIFHEIHDRVAPYLRSRVAQEGTITRQTALDALDLARPLIARYVPDFWRPHLEDFVLEALFRLGEMVERGEDDGTDDGVRSWDIHVVERGDPGQLYIEQVWMEVDENRPGERRILFANPENFEYVGALWVLFFGEMDAVFIAVAADHLEDALEEAARAMRDWGMGGRFSEPASQEEADASELTYTESGYIPSYEWGYLYDPSTVPAALVEAFRECGTREQEE